MPFSVLGIGCGRVGSLGNSVGPRVIARTLEQAAQRGITTFDTANIYGQGDSERILGRLFGNRPDIAIITKAGRVFSPKARLIGRMKWALRPAMALSRAVRPAAPPSEAPATPSKVEAVRSANVSQDFAPGALMSSFEGSLRRLRRDKVEGFLLHDPPPEVIRDAAVAEMMANVRASGRAVHVGVSLNEREAIAAVAEREEYSLIQLPLTLLEEAVEDAAYRELVARGVLVHVRQVLRRGDRSKVLDAGEAVRRAQALFGVSTVFVGVSRTDHLDALVACAG